MTQWLEKLRSEGRAAFDAVGLPSRRVEAWKYSDLARAMERDVQDDIGDGFSFSVPDAVTVEIVDGVCAPVAEGVGVRDLKALLAHPDPLVQSFLGQVAENSSHPVLALNTAFMEGGIVVHVPRQVTREKLVHLRYRWTKEQGDTEARHLRTLIVVEEEARVRFLETHEGPGARGLATLVTEVDLASAAHIDYARMEALGAGARQAAVLAVRAGRDAVFNGFLVSRGAAFSRHELLARLTGEGATLNVDGVYLVGEASHNDNTTIISHAVPNTTSRQMFRGVLSGSARGVFQGKVIVAPGAQGTDAQQQSRAILLSRQAEIDNKPELEIFADDVKCSHGATAGELDPAALFFLRARGIPEKEARALLVEGFLEQGLEALSDGELRALAHGFVRYWLDAHAMEVPDAGER